MIVLRFKTRVYPLEEKNLLTFYISQSPCCEFFGRLIGWREDNSGEKAWWGALGVDATDTRYGVIKFNLMGFEGLEVEFCPFCGRSVEALEMKRVQMIETKRVSHYTEFVEDGEIIVGAQVLPREADPR